MEDKKNTNKIKEELDEVLEHDYSTSESSENSSDAIDISDVEDADQTICFCHNVTKGELVKAMRSGSDTFEKCQSDTNCTTGCGGCEYDVRDLLEEEAEKKAKSKQSA